MYLNVLGKQEPSNNLGGMSLGKIVEIMNRECSGLTAGTSFNVPSSISAMATALLNDKLTEAGKPPFLYLPEEDCGAHGHHTRPLNDGSYSTLCQGMASRLPITVTLTTTAKTTQETTTTTATTGNHGPAMSVVDQSIDQSIKLDQGPRLLGALSARKKRECRLVPTTHVAHHSSRSPIAFVTCNWSYGHHLVDVNQDVSIQKPSRAVHSATVVGGCVHHCRWDLLALLVLHCEHRYSGGELVAEFVVGLRAARFPGPFHWQLLIALLAFLHEESRRVRKRSWANVEDIDIN
ncbi:hypothetical protein EDB89DRAFT_1905555 [Lactarius sanguifluus]|nr:hypothetical protein EDB89DRAFT_1905555 [Lactarius sanguifluus]